METMIMGYIGFRVKAYLITYMGINFQDLWNWQARLIQFHLHAQHKLDS